MALAAAGSTFGSQASPSSPQSALHSAKELYTSRCTGRESSMLQPAVVAPMSTSVMATERLRGLFIADVLIDSPLPRKMRMLRDSFYECIFPRNGECSSVRVVMGPHNFPVFNGQRSAGSQCLPRFVGG